ncbi:flagellar basal-body rod protein FlgF [Saccharophagus sp. K07]|jgi:flagellar basal-body rod protein FlgF|uniref:flagellar basal-body rod protein FlgF n=1 Tax=Saccharophagus sp. K07 TaxID=2283636 RepID=UPI0016525CB3|nr:flagellar basal-body rod protein FlgF [Saccharophagus sp. K07]MBC6907402.1 flagellar basal-body rod protein FlgF [Saccharophagus sp. K07]
MDKALYIAMTGAKHNMLSQTAHANNLANVNTTGFKADFAQARAMAVYYGDGLPTRAYALSERPATDFTIGSLQETGKDLDIAIDGEGFIAVQDSAGNEAYTRSGSLYIDSVGVLRTGNGLPVLGNGGPIAIPAAEKIEIGLDGSITVIPQGQGPEAPVVVDRIRLVNPNIAQMTKGEDGLFRALDIEGPLPPNAEVRLVSGFLENSNVNAIHELTSMLSLARQYELQVKVMSSSKEMSEASARLLQMNS